MTKYSHAEALQLLEQHCEQMPKRLTAYTATETNEHFEILISLGFRPSLMGPQGGVCLESTLSTGYLNRKRLGAQKVAYPSIEHAFLALRDLLRQSNEKSVETTEPESEGRKYDSGKWRFSLVPLDALQALAECLEYGAKKYGAHNWEKVEDKENRYSDALIRHLVAWRNGEWTDEESGLPHLSCVCANAMFLLASGLRQRKSESL